MEDTESYETLACKVTAQGNRIVIDGLAAQAVTLSVVEARSLAVQLQIALISAAVHGSSR